MNVKELFRLLKEMLQIGIISDYAIGGATALIYYVEPFQTQDVDIFVVVEEQQNLVSLSKIYSFLEEHGGQAQGEYITLNGVPAQFLVPYNDLVADAVKSSVEVLFDNVPVKIMRLEHLMAIMVQTGRTKDRARLEEIERLEIAYDHGIFAALLKQYGLEERWKKPLGI